MCDFVRVLRVRLSILFFRGFSVHLAALLATGALAACGKAQSPTEEALSCPGASVVGNVVSIPGGKFILGDGGVYPEEGPPVEVEIGDFDIDRTEVTNAQFARFVESTGYVTDAEHGLDPADMPGIDQSYLQPGSMVFAPPERGQPASPLTWWRFTVGASWRHPFGPDSSIVGKEHYPVVQVTYADALAYAQWKGRRLPTEAEWEYVAASGTLNSAPDSPDANYWQGIFPVIDTGSDGFKGLAPVGCYGPNKLGLYDMIGNVWEYTSSRYSPHHNSGLQQAEIGTSATDSTEPALYVIKGGSYLCAQNYCRRYRPQARQPQDELLAASHIGFRTVASREASKSEQNRTRDF